MKALIRRAFQAIDAGDAMIVAGLAAVGYGVSLVHVPSAWVAVGAVVFILGARR